ncbi:sugar transporter domain-containing protein [Ditylenchus destructor]|uniref:Sugar transporter domain-containing protein n=1 Tax=Ditylenchus destructor TaxID=166010 RepID=A0AAD4N211_9BILA|nr:sugar transporter domain-containing protein [Ditylenchus destructor]
MVSLFPNANRFHLLVALFSQFTYFFATQMIFPIFTSYVPRWRCSSGNHSDLISPSNSFGRDCKAFQECSAPNSIQYEHIYFESAALEFDWICGSRAYLATLFAQIQFIGVFTGIVTFGALSDRIGRKPVCVAILILGITMVGLSGLAPTWQLLFVCRFFIGVSCGGLTAVSTYIMEMVLPEQRIALRAFFNWGNGRIMLTLICFLFPNWRMASYICAICCLPALILMLFVFPESTIWLHHKGKLEQMRANERRVAKIAGVKYQEVQHDPIGKQYSFLELVKNREFMHRIGVLWVMWFAASVSSYGTDLNSSRIVGNLFLNQALFAILISLSKTLLIPFDAYNFNRRHLHQFAQIAIVICFFILTSLVLFDEQGISILIVNLLGVVFLEYSWDGCALCAIESMPTEMRATALGSCSLMARVGAILSPILAFLNTIWAPSAYLMLASIGSISLLVSCLWLDDTRGVNLDKVEIKEEQDEDQREECKSIAEEKNSLLEAKSAA